MTTTAPAPSTLDGYVRVSRVMGREGASYISPTVQREAIERYAAYRGLTIAEWHTDEDESGGTQNRPGLREAMRRIETGESGGLACWRLNRFARNVSGAIGDVERIQAAGAQLVFVEEDIDTTGPFGSFMLAILLAVATLERDNIVTGWETAKVRATKRGAKIGPTPYGYQRSMNDGTLSPHPEQAPIVARAFELAASVGSEGALAYLREYAPERTWNTFTLRRFVANRSYLGESRYGELVQVDAQPALVSLTLWTAAQIPEGPKRRQAASFPLSGLAKCGTCGEGMVGGRSGGRNGRSVRTYRCRASLTAFKGERCPHPALVNAEPLESYVRDQLAAVLADLRVRVGDRSADLAPFEAALADAEGELSAFAADLTLRRALGDGYPAHRDARVAAVTEAREAFEAAARSSITTTLAATELDAASDLAGLARAVLAAIVVQPGRGHIAERVRLDTL